MIWNGIKLNAVELDARFSSIMDELEPFIMCIHEVDPTGQTFRYSYDMETQKKHLVPVSVINIINLKNQFKLIIEHLDKLIGLASNLNHEYAMKTFTKKLSRHDIRSIASKLPVRSKWKDGALDTVKLNIRKEYNIGSRELSKAIRFIEVTHDFSFLIGIEQKPLGLSIDDLLIFSDVWGQRNDINEWRDELLRALDVDRIVIHDFAKGVMKDKAHKIMLSLQRDKEAFGKLMENANPNNISGLLALCLHMENSFSEQYVALYESNLKYLKKRFSQGGGEWVGAVEEIWNEHLKNITCLKKIIISLRRLNMPSAANALEKHCMVEGLIH
ncbi:hypothetical protein [Aeromonas dhakensis]